MSNGIDQTKALYIYTDGGSRGNPGEAALGVYILDSQEQAVSKIGKRLGVATNNVAEYSAIVEGLSWVLQNKKRMPVLSKINLFMDSQLAVSQINGLYKIKNARLRDFIFEIKSKEKEIGLPISYSYIPREKNKNADMLVNLALDNKI